MRVKLDKRPKDRCPKCGRRIELPLGMLSLDGPREGPQTVPKHRGPDGKPCELGGTVATPWSPEKKKGQVV